MLKQLAYSAPQNKTTTDFLQGLRLDPTYIGAAAYKLPWAVTGIPTLISLSEKWAEFPSGI